MTIEIGSLVQHKCGGPTMYVFERPKDGFLGFGCFYWNAVTGTFQQIFLIPDELVPVDDRA